LHPLGVREIAHEPPEVAWADPLDDVIDEPDEVSVVVELVVGVPAVVDPAASSAVAWSVVVTAAVVTVAADPS
jgi:hypothetical protein